MFFSFNPPAICINQQDDLQASKGLQATLLQTKAGYYTSLVTSVDLS